METQIIVCNATQIRVEFKRAEVRGIEHDGSCWFEIVEGEVKPIGRYSTYGSPVLAHRTESYVTEATKAAKARLEILCNEAARQWVAAGGLTALDAQGNRERLEAVKDAERALEAALEAVSQATAKLEAARKAAGV